MSVKVAVTGCGLWGRNLVRNFYNLESLYGICDMDAEMLAQVAKDYEGIECISDFNKLLTNDEIQGIIIATPSHTHYPLTKKALEAGKNVYVEKPIAVNSEEARELMELAEEKGLVLMVGHLLLYHPVVNRIKQLVKEGVLGEVTYIQSDRLNVNFFRNDRSVLWDLAPHDLSMVGYILDKKPLRVTSASGCSVNNDGIVDITHVDIELEDGVQAHISDSWIHPLKKVVLLVRGTKASAVFDDSFQEKTFELYDNMTTEKKLIDCPDYIEIEPLKLECQHFLSCIKNKTKPRTDGLNGYETVKILEEAEKIMLGSQYGKISNIKLASSRKKQNT